MNLARMTLLTVISVALGCGDDSAKSDFTGGQKDAGSDAGEDGIQSGTLIKLGAGELQGDDQEGSRRFLGIPYAKAPVGALRWKAPEPSGIWDGVLEAKEYGPRCPQLMSLQGAASDIEDCLHLNVWTPSETPSEPLPVMVWFHGGGNSVGATSDDIPLNVGGKFYEGSVLAATYGVVVVSANYRLGALGFFSHPGLRDEDSPAGNQGLLDQRMALQWVQDNIEAFGGDAQNVTVFGESAGSADICVHMVSPGSRGLFHRAISQSGGCTFRMPTLEEAEQNAEAFVEAMGCADASDQLSCLRDKPAGDLVIEPPVDGGPADPLPGGSFYQGGDAVARWSFTIVVDGELLPEQPRALYDSAEVADVPLIFGTNTDEGTLFHIGVTAVADEAEYLAALQRAFGDDAEAILELYPVADFESADAALQRVTGDFALVCNALDSGIRAAAAGLTVYAYNFDQPIPIPAIAYLGATHGAEIAYVFGTAEDATADDPDQRAISMLMQGYWTRFAETGDPNGGGALMWPEFSADNDVRLNINADPSVVEDFRAEQCAFWRGRNDGTFE